MESSTGNRWQKYIVFLVVLNFLAILEISKLFFWRDPFELDHLGKTYLNLLLSWLLYGLLLLPIVKILNRRPIRKGDWVLPSLAVGLVGLIFILLHPLIYDILDLLISRFPDPSYSYMYRYFEIRQKKPIPEFFELYRLDLQSSFHILFWIYASTVGILYSVNYYRLLRKSERDKMRLETGLAKARLELLAIRLQPHFLFNTLNSVSELMHQDVEAADRMITRLSDLLRLVLEEEHMHMIPLQKELYYLDFYLDIEKIRFQDKLKVHMQIEEQAKTALVPFLLLQPLVEHAVRNGISRICRPGTVEIMARQEGKSLLLDIRYDGPPEKEHATVPVSESALYDIRERLQQIYSDRAEMEILPWNTGGRRIILRLPQNPFPLLFSGQTSEV